MRKLCLGVTVFFLIQLSGYIHTTCQLAAYELKSDYFTQIVTTTSLTKRLKKQRHLRVLITPVRTGLE